MKILIIEEHPLYTDALERYLKQKQFEDIVVTNTGVDAIKIIEMERVDIAILDGMMVDAESPEICRRIKDISPKTRVVIQIGFFMDNDAIAKLSQAGADAIIVKNEHNFSSLEDALAELLPR